MRPGFVCRVIAAGCLLGGPVAPAAVPAMPMGFGDICLGGSIDALTRTLDLRDIDSALAELKGGTGKPDLGARGYGCSRRDDAYADITCVSHDEHPEGLQLREIRLQFRRGLLRQLSITAELRESGALRRVLERRLGRPMKSPDAAAEWRDSSSRVQLHEGPNLVFVVFDRDPAAAEQAVECGSAR